MQDYRIDADRNKIHATSIIELGAVLGSDNYIGPFCIISGDVVIGNRNRFESHCVVGCIPDVHGYEKDDIPIGKAMVGDDNYFSQFVTISAGTYRQTKIGNHCLFQKCAHAGHDIIMGNYCTLSVGTTLGGDSVVEDFVNFGLCVVTHPQTVQKRGCIYGMNSTVTKKTEQREFAKFVGSPAKLMGANIKAREVYEAICFGSEPSEYAKRFMGDREILLKARNRVGSQDKIGYPENG